MSGSFLVCIIMFLISFINSGLSRLSQLRIESSAIATLLHSERHALSPSFGEGTSNQQTDATIESDMELESRLSLCELVVRQGFSYESSPSSVSAPQTSFRPPTEAASLCSWCTASSTRPPRGRTTSARSRSRTFWWMRASTCGSATFGQHVLAAALAPRSRCRSCLLGVLLRRNGAPRPARHNLHSASRHWKVKTFLYWTLAGICWSTIKQYTTVISFQWEEREFYEANVGYSVIKYFRKCYC